MFKLLALLAIFTASMALAAPVNYYSKDIGNYVPADQIGGTNYVKIKIAVGDDGTATPVSSNNPLPISGTIATVPGTHNVVQFLDTNAVLDSSSVNIPGSGSSILTVVATLGQTVSQIDVSSTVGQYIGLYQASTLKFIIGPGMDRTVDLSLTNGTAIGLRSMSAAAIASGKIAIQFRQ